MAQHIEDYAVIGDLRTAAMVGNDGAIDWLCFPRFDSPAVCAALLGDSRHGQWSLAPVDRDRRGRRRYRRGTLILETEWTTADGAVLVTDFMVPGSSCPMVVRIVDGLVGTVAMGARVAPRTAYGKEIPALHRDCDRLVATAGRDRLWLAADVDLNVVEATWAGQFSVTAGQRVSFVLTYSAVDELVPPVQPAGEALAVTDEFWTEWIGRSTYHGPWQAEVEQSLVVLKALTYAPTGSMLAAATTSLPEQLGGSRNWDYRYSWLRDATFSARALLAAGYVDEVVAWRDWLIKTVGPEASIMYSVDGAADLPEQTLDWLPGHAGSSPVRIGNAACTQQQNDVWGEVLDALARAREAGVPDAAAQDELERSMLDRIEQQWGDPDHGLWEVRGPRRHFVHSKLLAWAGVDRVVRSLDDAEQPDERARLQALRDDISRELGDRGYNAGRRAFTQSYGSPRLDAAVLLLPRYGFLSWDDPRMISTVDAIQRDLTDDGLVLRYAVDDDGPNVDGVPGGEGTFLATSFWLADALHGVGRVDEAVDLFERLLSLRNDVGLLSEEYDARTGHHVGNTPQAFSHAGLVTTAVTLSAAAASRSARTDEEAGVAVA